MVRYGLVFLLYSVVYILFPGRILLRTLQISLKDDVFCNRVLLSYFLGFCLLIAEYFLCSLIGAFWLFAAVSPTILAVYFLLRHGGIREEIRGARKACDLRRAIACAAVVVFCFAVSFVYVTLRFGNLLSRPYITLNQDFANHVGLVASLSRGLPAADLKVSGVTLYYHYFQDLMFGMCENIFHIPAFDLVIDCTPLMVGGVFGIALFCLLKPECRGEKYTKSDGLRAVLRCGFFLVFGGAWALPLTGAGYESGFWSWNNYHIFTSVNACGFALAALLAVLVFLKNIDLGRAPFRNLLVLAALVFAATGAKGPFAAVFVAAFAAVYGIAAVGERNIKKPLLSYVLAAGISFLLTFFFVIRGPLPFGLSQTTGMKITLDGTLRNTVISSFDSVGLLAVPYLAVLIKIALLTLIAFGPLVLYTGFCAAGELRKIMKARSADHIFLGLSVGMVLIGAAGFAFVSQTGYSQVYFLLAAIAPLVYIALHFTAELPAGEKRRGVLCLILIALFGTHLFISDLHVQLTAGYAARGWFGYSEDLSPSLSNVSASEAEGLRWLYDHTPGSAVVLTDRRSNSENDQAEDDCLFFEYSAISERQMFLEGFSYSAVSPDEIREKIGITDRIYASSGDELADLLRDNGIDYIIVTKRMGTRFAPDSALVRLCFENDGMEIYQRAG